MANHRVLIEQLATEMGVGKYAVDKWRLRGVPHKYRLPLIRMAAERGVQLTEEDFQSPLRQAGEAKTRPGTQPTTASRRRAVA